MARKTLFPRPLPHLSHTYTQELWQMDFCGKEQQQQQQQKHVAGGKLSLCVCVFSGKMCHEASILLARE